MLVAALVIVGALAFLLVRVGDAAVYFKTTKEAVAQKDELGTRRFRIEGKVVPGSVTTAGAKADQTVRFSIEEAGVRVRVIHAGDAPDLFQDGIPVVLEGHWSGDHFASDRILVKHSEQYRADNPDRVRDYPKK